MVTSTLLAAGWTVLDNLRKRNFEPEAMWIPRLLTPKGIGLHVGASNGRHTYLMAKAATCGHIYAFEPSSFTFPILKQVMRLHRLHNVSCYNLAICDKQGTARLSVPIKLNGQMGHSFGYIQTDGTRQRNDLRFKEETVYPVQTITLDHFVNRENLRGVDLIRIDAEGAEGMIIHGSKSLFEQFRPNALIEFHPHILRNLFSTDCNDLLGFFFNLGYECFYLKEGNLVPTDRIIEERFRDYFLLHPARRVGAIRR